MGSQSGSQIFPLSFKTAAMSNLGPSASSVGIDAVYDNSANPKFGVIGIQLYQPYNIYAVKKLKMHFRCKFGAGVTTPQQVISKIVVGSNGGGVPSSTAPSMAVNYTPTSGVIDFTVDLRSLITPTGDNIVFLYFPKALVPGDSAWSGSYSQIQIQIWKLDMLYQTLGVHR